MSSGWQLVDRAAWLYAAICAGVIVFQFCLIAGAPWGHLTQGGRHAGALPGSGRVFAAFSVCLLVSMAGSVLSGAAERQTPGLRRFGFGSVRPGVTLFINNR